MFVSTSPVPKIPWPVLNSQSLVLTLLFAGPLKLSDQTCFHGTPGVVGLVVLAGVVLTDAVSADDEQPRMAKTASVLSPAASRRNRCEPPVRSPAPSAGRLPGPINRRHVGQILALISGPYADKGGRTHPENRERVATAAR